MRINPLDMIDRLNQVRKDKLKAIKDWRTQRKAAVRLADLSRLTHQVGKVELPFPTIMAYEAIERYFGSWDDIRLDDMRHLGAVVYFLKHSHDAKACGITGPQLEEAISSQMAAIGYLEQVEYMACINEIFYTVKKKSITSQMEMYRKTLELLGTPAGA